MTLIAGAFACESGDPEPETPTVTPGPIGTAAVASATAGARSTPTARAGATAASSVSPGGTVSPSPTAIGSSPTSTPPPAATPTSTPRPTATPTPRFSNAIAAAGNDIDSKISNFVGLNGSGSSDPDRDQLTYTWTQVHGPDVTGGVGRFVGPTPSFAVPESVSTLIFDLTVNDGTAESRPDRVRINVFEHTGNPGLFIDGNRGSDDTGNGSRENPFASISFAINRINGPDEDLHVMSLDDGSAYEEADTLGPPTTASLYGGYGPDWIRDVENNKTKLNGASLAVWFSVVNADAWLSGFDITAADADSPGQSTFAVKTDRGSATLTIEDNVLRTGNAGDGTQGGVAGSSYGVLVGTLFNVVIQRNEIIAGNGGEGLIGSKGSDGGSATTNGSNGSGPTGGTGGKGGVSSANGGRGGNGGTGLIPVDGQAGGGVGGGVGDKVGDGRVGDGGGGAGGAGGDGGTGGVGYGAFDTSGLFQPRNGTNGKNSANGAGGGGGGGGAGGVGLDGGAGGGGGGGGVGGRGGNGGVAGGASIGIVLMGTVGSTIEENMIVAGNGGRGGNGGAGGTGGRGTKGGVGAPNVCSFLGCDIGRSGDGGEGGGGGSGGIGGQGGGGAGGPSYGIVVGPGVTPTVIGNRIVTGRGGNGGIGGAAGLGGSPGGSGGSSGGSGGCCSFQLETAGTSGGGGAGGWSYAVYDVAPTDGWDPILEGNDLVPGTPGAGSAINGDPGESGETNL